MSTTILAQKLYIPPPRPKIVLRPRLVEQLSKVCQQSHTPGVTLISAPAGFGKTTLISEWVATCGRPVVWLSLDEGDNDLARFLTYLIAGLQKIAGHVGESVLGMLQSSQAPPIEPILTLLLNEITAVPDDFIFVLDDYHVIESRPVENALVFLLEHLPPQMNLVISTREDPVLPLARLRARGQLNELRAADLRFTPAEAAEFLNQVMGLHLSAVDVAALENRTEGWIAGLQLAAISMRGHQDPSGFIQSFTGSHHFVLDYLVEEVLQRQPETIQKFLLHTSIFDRLCGSLCDAVLRAPTGSGQETLETIERANLFIVPLDHERRWYRYHHLFADLLRNRLERVYADQIVELRRRASDWYAVNDFPNEAIAHALAIQDWSRAADTFERFSDELPMRGDRNTRLGWFESFPAQFLLDRPQLGLLYAWTLYMTNQLDRAEQLLNQLMPRVLTIPPLLGELFAIRVMIASQRHDLPAVIETAREALSLVPFGEALPRSRILLSLGVAYHELGGDIAAAKSALREAYELGNVLAPSSAVGNAPLPLTALAYLAEIEWLQGNLHDALRMYDQAVGLVERWNGGSSIAQSLIQLGRAGLLYEWNDLEGAARALQESIRVGELWKNLYLLVHAYGLSALVMLAHGQVEEARAQMRHAEQITRDWQATPPDLGSLALYQIALWIALNDFQSVARWEQSHGFEWQVKIGRARDTLAIILARARIALYYRRHDGSALDQARALIEPALAQSQVGGLRFAEVRLLILDALTNFARKDTAAAIRILKRALTLAGPENYVRSFLDMGEPVQEFLLWSLESQSLGEPHLREYVNKLLSHFGGGFKTKPSQLTGEGLAEPLSRRELEVLRLIAQGLSNREIGERLFLALSTVKGHTRIIFDKLQVQRRTEAVSRARELGLL